MFVTVVPYSEVGMVVAAGKPEVRMPQIVEIGLIGEAIELRVAIELDE
jgi:hypothetical protein